MPQKPKAAGKGAAKHLKPSYCPQNAATACGKGAARDLEAGYCLTSLSETRRKSPGKRLAGFRKAPGRWPKDMLLGRKDAGKGFKAA